jgi:hypothetical protein
VSLRAVYAGDMIYFLMQYKEATDSVRRSPWRKLATGSEYDVQFTDLKKEYAFGVAVFDNAQGRHAYTPGVLRLKFE